MDEEKLEEERKEQEELKELEVLIEDWERRDGLPLKVHTGLILICTGFWIWRGWEGLAIAGGFYGAVYFLTLTMQFITSMQINLKKRTALILLGSFLVFGIAFGSLALGCLSGLTWGTLHLAFWLRDRINRSEP